MKQNLSSVAIQGEIVGPTVNGNKLHLKDLDYQIFDIWDIDFQKYYDHKMVNDIVSRLGLNRVPEIFHGPFPESLASVKDLLALADSLSYGADLPAEGIVVRLDEPVAN